MAKKSKDGSRSDRVRRELARAQADLHTAQDERRLAMVRGEQAVEKARQRAARWLEKATRRVERRAAAVSQIEVRLAATAPPATPEQAADSLQRIQEEHDATPQGQIVSPADGATAGNGAASAASEAGAGSEDR
jgi:hypothetical protein